MPTPDYDTPSVSTTTNIVQQSTVCPTPLTPPAESGDLDDLDRVNHPRTQPILNNTRDHEEGMVSDNTGHGMIASQEDSLYPSPEATPDVEDAAGSLRSDKDRADLVHDGNMMEKADQATEIMNSDTPGLFVPLSPTSLPSSSPPLTCELPQQYGISNRSTENDDTLRQSFQISSEISLVSAEVDEVQKHGSLHARFQGATKVDRELNWSIMTSPFDFTYRRTEPRYPSSVFQCDSRYKGTQQSDRQIYNVSVRVLTVDIEQCSCTGYLTIKGLTPEHDTLQTYFTGEIIGGPDQKYSFRTKIPEWGANEKTDLMHWARFPAWRPYSTPAKKNVDFDYPPNGENWWQQENIFMRWKEHFLVPDHKTKSIAGASFEGFYYICLNQVEGKISGIYFHSKSERYQQLELKHEGDAGIWHRGVTPSVEFR